MKTRSLFTRSSLRSLTLCGLGSAALALAGPATRAAVVTFIGTDVGAGPTDPRPNSNTAAAEFDPASVSPEGQVTFDTFENEPTGNFTSLDLGYGVTLTGTDGSGNSQSILDAPEYSPQPSLAGYNTTVGGANYLNLLGGTATFSFSTPITAFGAYFTGVQTAFGTVTLSFNDGTGQTVTVPAEPDDSGGVSFVGFTDAGHTISSVTVTSGSGGASDYIGLDDVRFTLVPIPEPSTVALLAGAGVLLACAGSGRRVTRA
jgi:hypothetical protein